MRMIELLKGKYLKLFSTLLLPVVFIAAGCTNSLNNDNAVSDNPVNTAIIGLSANPGTLFGNGCSDSVIQVNTNIVEDGTPIEFEITFSSSIPPNQRGCLFDATPFVFDDIAFVNYLAGILVGVGELATINISATVDKGGGDTEADFITLTLQGVGINTPGNQDLDVPNPQDEEALDVFVTLAFTTVGIKPGTVVEVSLSNPSLGFFEDGTDVTFPVVAGSEESGEFFVQYNALRAGGTQVITARIILEIPPELAAICPIPPEEDIIVEATFSITQSVDDPPMMDDMME